MDSLNNHISVNCVFKIGFTKLSVAGPDIASMGLANSLEDTSNAVANSPALAVDMSLDDIDDEEIDTYIMSENEYEMKNGLWHELNATYLEEQKSK